MNATEFELDASLRSMLDQHLDAIESVLAESGLSRAERRNICDEVEAQATEMVWQRGEGNPPSPQLMAAVIAELDDPEAYRDGDPPAMTTVSESNEKHPEAKLHPFSLWALLTPILGFMLMFTPFGPKGEVYGFIWLGLLAAMSITFSSIAIRDIRHEPQRYYGVTGSLFESVSNDVNASVYERLPFLGRIMLWLILISITVVFLFLVSALI